MSNEEQTCRRFQVTVDRSSLSPLPGLSGRQSGQRRRDLSAFGLTAGGHNIVVNEARGQWACVHRGRLRGVVEAARSSHRLGGGTDSGGGATLALAATILCYQ